MSNLNITNWKYFYLKDLFYINKGKRLTKEDSIDGNIPFITAGEEKLGISRYIGNEVEQFSYSITIDMFGFSCYRDFVFACDDNIIVLKLKNNDSKYIYNFISTIINYDKYRMGYGRQYRLKILKNHKIKLPSKLNQKNKYEPDWEYMEEYIQNIEKKSIKRISKFNNIFSKKNNKKIDIENWKEFKIKNIFDITRGKRLVENERISGEIEYYSASEYNNGMTDKINNPLFLEENAIIYTTFGKSYYIQNTFTASDEINILKNLKLNKYNSLFLLTILNKKIYKFVYGRKAFRNRIENEIIKLPAKLNKNNKYEPDWEYMENYIKNTIYGKYL